MVESALPNLDICLVSVFQVLSKDVWLKVSHFPVQPSKGDSVCKFKNSPHWSCENLCISTVLWCRRKPYTLGSYGKGVEMGSCDMTQFNRPPAAYPVYMLSCVPAGFSPAREVQSPAPGEEQPQAPACAGATRLESSCSSWSTPR